MEESAESLISSLRNGAFLRELHSILEKLENQRKDLDAREVGYRGLFAPP